MSEYAACEIEDRAWTRLMLLTQSAEELNDRRSCSLERAGLMPVTERSSAQDRLRDVILFSGVLVRRGTALRLAIALCCDELAREAMTIDQVFRFNSEGEEGAYVEDFDVALEQLHEELPEEVWPFTSHALPESNAGPQG